MPVLRTVTFCTLWALMCWLIGLWLGAVTGWALFGIGLLTSVLLMATYQQRIQRWANNLDQPPPTNIGKWDPILAPIYRRLRQQAQATQQLQDNACAMLLAAEALPDGALTLNANRELTWCNQTARRHLRLKPKTDWGHSIFNILRVPEFARYARQKTWPAPLIMPIQRRGQTRTLLIQMSRYGLAEFLIVTRDITRIQQLETMRKDFVANVTQELSQPLAVMNSYLEALHPQTQEQGLAPEQQRYLGLIQEQALRMQATVDDLLVLSALESTPYANGRRVLLSQLCQQCLERAQARSAGDHHFISQIEADITLTGIESEITSAIDNLLDNAIHYTLPDGEIHLTLKRQTNGTVSLSVIDTGIGIARQDIPRLTERFYRSDHRSARPHRGTGLGLAIVRHIALRHDTELTIQSRLGQGSRFTLHFPRERILLD